MEEHLASIGRPAGLPRAMLVGFLDAVPASAAILDSGGDVIAVNSAWRRFATCNGGDPDAWIGRNYLTITDQADDAYAEAIGAGLRSVLAGERDSFDHEYPCHSPREQRWFRCLTSRLSDSDATVLGAAVMHLDVSAQKRAEFSARDANRAKTEFLANLSHELRTPLNAIIGFSEMMTLQVWGPLGDDHYGSYAGDIHRAGRHLLSLINEVLDLSKVEAGRFELHEEAVDVAEVVRQAHALVADRADRSGVTLRHILDASLPRLHADARLVSQILLNLLSNAVKFTPQGGCVTTVATLGVHGWLEMSVRDTGIGIAAEDIAQALEPFGQVDSEMGRRYSAESTGLGLPLSRRFMELHGGHLRLESTPGAGTVVTACFPPARVIAD